VTTPRFTKITTWIATLVAIAAIGAPSALAVGPQPHGQPDAASTRGVAVASDAAGFDWTAAAIGALAATGACVVVIGLVHDIRRRHEPNAV
jgi:hypothetical protein